VGFGTVVADLGQLVNGVFVIGLLMSLVFGGHVISDEGLQLIRSVKVNTK
jgi:hypothetical protein